MISHILILIFTNIKNIMIVITDIKEINNNSYRNCNKSMTSALLCQISKICHSLILPQNKINRYKSLTFENDSIYTRS